MDNGSVSAQTVPRNCGGCMGITVREPAENTPVPVMNGRCTNCSYRMAWSVIRINGSRYRRAERLVWLMSALDTPSAFLIQSVPVASSLILLFL